MDGYVAVFLGVALNLAILAMGFAFAKHARALAGSRSDSLTDTLTGLGNRRRLLEDLDDALADPHDARLLVVLDLDGFKAYNDVYGHPAGDALLARLGRRIEAALPDGARAYRLGGDEFCALVADRGRNYDAIVEAVARSLSDSGDGVTASHGMIAIPREADSPERALQLADRRLYADKSARHQDSASGEARHALSEALQDRDAEPEGFDPVTELAGRVARTLGLWGEDLELVVRAAELHDVGKAAMPEDILSEPRRLGAADSALLRRHTLAGEHLLASSEPLSQVAALVRACDEHFDGSGDPDGLAGDEIPVGARIVAACETYHALTAREAEPHRAAIIRMRQQAGHRFDPNVVEALDLANGPARGARPDRGARAGMVATLAIGALLLLLPGSALAGTASLTAGKLNVKASPGQNNKLTIEAGTDSRGSGALIKEEAHGATISPGAGCSNFAPGQVYCPLPNAISVDAGDGDDSVVVYSWIGATLRGGPGNDQLYGSAGKDVIDGQDGNDTLGGGYGGDTIKGGPGNDTVTFSYFTSPVAVSLDGLANDGIANDHSNVSGDVENIIGGPNADTLVGDGDANTIEGGPGSDVVRGNGGGDTLRVRDDTHDQVFCGVGHDSVDADTSDALAADCDNSVITSLQAPLVLAAPTPLRLATKPVRLSRNGVAAVTLRCSANLPGGCRGSVTLDTAPATSNKAKASTSRKARRRVLGKTRFSARRGRLAVVRVHISRNGRRRVLRRRKLRCRASVAIRRADGSLTTVRTTLTLTAPKGGSQ
jgi:diguanylate cyclase (GGDEF)-like protein